MEEMKLDESPGFPNFDSRQEFYDFVENETDLYALNYLGYPWYWAYKMTINTGAMERAKRTPSQEIESIRFNDFKNKLPLLSKQYDYAFFLKSKMRSSSPTQIENLYAKEVLDYLKKEGKTFIIFEQLDNNPNCDLKYLKSEYAEHILPYEYIKEAIAHQIVGQLQSMMNEYVALVNDKFANATYPDRHLARINQMQKTYLELVNLIPNIVCNQILLKQLNIKALFGGMGHHLMAGLSNDFSVVEIGHGYPGPFAVLKRIHKPAKDYLKNNLGLNRFYQLFLSTADYITDGEYLCLDENRLNYGMPDLRAYHYSEDRIKDLLTKLDVQESERNILITTSGWVQHQKLNKIILEILNRFDRVNVLLKPHPSYENEEKHSLKHPRFKTVTNENKHDLFSISDIVISVPSSMAREASRFTDKVIVFPDAAADSLYAFHVLRFQYPEARVVPLGSRQEFLNTLDEFLSSPRSKKDFTKTIVDPDRVINELFNRIGMLNFEERGSKQEGAAVCHGGAQ